MGWEECVLLRKEKWSVCSGKHVALHPLLQPRSPLAGKGGSQQRMGGNVKRSRQICCGISSCQIRMRHVGCFFCLFIQRQAWRAHWERTCVVMNVPPEGRTLARMACLQGSSQVLYCPTAQDFCRIELSNCWFVHLNTMQHQTLVAQSEM